MPKYSVTYSDRFKKNYKKLDANVKKQLKNKVSILMENPFHPSLIAIGDRSLW